MDQSQFDETAHNVRTHIMGFVPNLRRLRLKAAANFVVFQHVAAMAHVVGTANGVRCNLIRTSSGSDNYVSTYSWEERWGPGSFRW